MVYRLDDENVGFPDPRLADPDGLAAVGGSMDPEWLLNAYYFGFFPWYTEKGVPYWFSLDPRMVLKTEDFRLSDSLRRTIRSGRYEVRIDTCFREVMECCSKVERKEECGESWITDDFVEAYCRLHELGFAHSFETFEDGELVGGLYGVSLCDWFSGESMFHFERDASKVAFARLVDFALMHGFRFIDAQQPTRHLASLGAREMEREHFLTMLGEGEIEKSYRGRWHNNSVVLLLGGNQGERVEVLMRAIAEIGWRIGTVSRLSSMYETTPWGFEAEEDFLNMAVVVDTDMGADEVLETALQIECELGRKREGAGYQSRPIDIDLIFFNNEIIKSAKLELPHPRMQERRFVLVPLAEIMPDYKDPKSGKTMTKLLDECGDTGEVRKYF